MTRIELTVCEPCLAGEGGECHTPGCSYCWCDGPTGEHLRWLRSSAACTVPWPDEPSPTLAAAIQAMTEGLPQSSEATS